MTLLAGLTKDHVWINPNQLISGSDFQEIGPDDGWYDHCLESLGAEKMQVIFGKHDENQSEWRNHEEPHFQMDP